MRKMLKRITDFPDEFARYATFEQRLWRASRAFGHLCAFSLAGLVICIATALTVYACFSGDLPWWATIPVLLLSVPLALWVVMAMLPGFVMQTMMFLLLSPIARLHASLPVLFGIVSGALGGEMYLSVVLEAKPGLGSSVGTVCGLAASLVLIFHPRFKRVSAVLRR